MDTRGGLGRGRTRAAPESQNVLAPGASMDTCGTRRYSVMSISLLVAACACASLSRALAASIFSSACSAASVAAFISLAQLACSAAALSSVAQMGTSPATVPSSSRSGLPNASNASLALARAQFLFVRAGPRRQLRRQPNTIRAKNTARQASSPTVTAKPAAVWLWASGGACGGKCVVVGGATGGGEFVVDEDGDGDNGSGGGAGGVRGCEVGAEFDIGWVMMSQSREWARLDGASWRFRQRVHGCRQLLRGARNGACGNRVYLVRSS